MKLAVSRCHCGTRLSEAEVSLVCRRSNFITETHVCFSESAPQLITMCAAFKHSRGDAHVVNYFLRLQNSQKCCFSLVGVSFFIWNEYSCGNLFFCLTGNKCDPVTLNAPLSIFIMSSRVFTPFRPPHTHAPTLLKVHTSGRSECRLDKHTQLVTIHYLSVENTALTPIDHDGEAWLWTGSIKVTADAWTETSIYFFVYLTQRF